MSTCMCGNPVDTIGDSCSRCGALQTLGLGMFASRAEIESTYLTLVKVWHPDRFQSDPKLRSAAEEKLKEINAAHDYLNSGPTIERPRSSVREAEPVAEPEPEVERKDEYVPPEPMEEEPEEVRRVLKRYKRRSGSGVVSRMIVFRLIVAAGGLVALALLWVASDSFLSENQTTARPWGELKAEISRNFHATGLRLWSDVADKTHESKDENAQPAAPQAAQGALAQAPTAKVQAPVQSRVAPTANEAQHGAKPYVTSGLTPVEVLSILGNPTSSSGEKMFYQGSEIDFRNGHVAGWKIDSKSPVRVKLWPDQQPVPGMTTFGVGSSKSDVIAVQGTPMLFSDREFGYGGSIVFFQNDRVVSWKEDPATARLRVAH